jgi:hypothetical protein
MCITPFPSHLYQNPLWMHDLMSHTNSSQTNSLTPHPSLLLSHLSSVVYLSYCTTCTPVFHSSRRPPQQLLTTEPSTSTTYHTTAPSTSFLYIKEAHTWWSNSQPPHRTTAASLTQPTAALSHHYPFAVILHPEWPVIHLRLVAILTTCLVILCFVSALVPCK